MRWKTSLLCLLEKGPGTSRSSATKGEVSLHLPLDLSSLLIKEKRKKRLNMLEISCKDFKIMNWELLLKVGTHTENGDILSPYSD